MVALAKYLCSTAEGIPPPPLWATAGQPCCHPCSCITTRAAAAAPPLVRDCGSAGAGSETGRSWLRTLHRWMSVLDPPYPARRRPGCQNLQVPIGSRPPLPVWGAFRVASAAFRNATGRLYRDAKGFLKEIPASASLNPWQRTSSALGRPATSSMARGCKKMQEKIHRHLLKRCTKFGCPTTETSTTSICCIFR